jgi:hypothetical protein
MARLLLDGLDRMLGPDHVRAVSEAVRAELADLDVLDDLDVLADLDVLDDREVLRELQAECALHDAPAEAAALIERLAETRQPVYAVLPRLASSGASPAIVAVRVMTRDRRGGTPVSAEITATRPRLAGMPLPAWARPMRRTYFLT